MAFTWTTEAHDEAIRLAEAGKSANEIAQALGTEGEGPTRNSVIGKLHRRRIKLCGMPKHVATREPKARTARRKSNGSTVMNMMPKIEDDIEADPVEYLNMRSDECKAILEQRGGDWLLPLVCGRKQVDGYPYCRKHVRLYYNPQQQPMRKSYGQTG
jgi:hypothetical protein